MQYCNHPTTPKVCIYKGFCVKGSYFCIIMKLYGGSLSQRIARAPGELGVHVTAG
jgi:hypothetical protein